jgi:hypothetical protein
LIIGLFLLFRSLPVENRIESKPTVQDKIPATTPHWRGF